MAASDPTEVPDGVPEEGVDALYGLPLDEFTPARDTLAKELRAEGGRAAADWVKALKKPTATAWLVNQLARTQKADAKRVLDSGEAVRAAQDRAVAGKGKPGELAEAAEELGRAMRTLLGKAPGLLDRQGRSPSTATLDRAAETLRAIALDDEARAGFASGRLTRERQASGLGFAPGAAPPAARKRSGAARIQEKERKARAQAALKEAKAKHREQGQKVAELERALKKAQSALEAARVEHAKTQALVEEAEAAAKGKS